MLTPDRRQEGTKKMNPKTTFTPLYDWIAKRHDLSLLEKLIVCRVLRYGDGGCFESYSNISKAFHIDRSNLIKNIQALKRKQWLAVLYEPKNRRVIWVNPDKFRESDEGSPGPLFELPAVQKSKCSGLKPPVNDAGGSELPVNSGAKPTETVAQNHPNKEIVYTDKREEKQQELNFQSEGMIEKPKIRLFPIKGKNCSVPGCGMPAVYKDTSGTYDNYKCSEHMPEKVKAVYC